MSIYNSSNDTYMLVWLWDAEKILRSTYTFTLSYFQHFDHSTLLKVCEKSLFKSPIWVKIPLNSCPFIKGAKYWWSHFTRVTWPVHHKSSLHYLFPWQRMCRVCCLYIPSFSSDLQDNYNHFRKNFSFLFLFVGYTGFVIFSFWHQIIEPLKAELWSNLTFTLVFMVYEVRLVCILIMGHLVYMVCHLCCIGITVSVCIISVYFVLQVWPKLQRQRIVMVSYTTYYPSHQF